MGTPTAIVPSIPLGFQSRYQRLNNLEVEEPGYITKLESEWVTSSPLILTIDLYN